MVLALLAGIGTICVSHFMVRPRIEKAEQEAKDNNQKYLTEQSAKNRIQTELNTTKQTLATTQSELETTKSNLAAKTDEAAKAGQQVGKLTGELKTAKAETQKVISESKEFFELKKSVAQIKKAFADLASTTKERDVFTKENKVLQVEVNRLKNKLRELDRNSLIAPTVRLPAGLSGKITSVDPKYEFVILNVGGKQGALVDGEMVVTRDGELISKVRISSVEPDYSVANVIQSWKKKDVVEGDTVLVQ